MHMGAPVQVDAMLFTLASGQQVVLSFFKDLCKDLLRVHKCSYLFDSERVSLCACAWRDVCMDTWVVNY